MLLIGKVSGGATGCPSFSVCISPLRGIFGPKYVVVPSGAEDTGNAPYTLADNPMSHLDKSDLVFIDPVGTGFSKLAGAGTAADVWTLANDAKAFATDEYLPALFKGSALPESEFNDVAGKLAYFTGLPESLIKRSNLRVSARRHQKLLLADEGYAGESVDESDAGQWLLRLFNTTV